MLDFVLFPAKRYHIRRKTVKNAILTKYYYWGLLKQSPSTVSVNFGMQTWAWAHGVLFNARFYLDGCILWYITTYNHANLNNFGIFGLLFRGQIWRETFYSTTLDFTLMGTNCHPGGTTNRKFDKILNFRASVRTTFYFPT